MGLLLSWTSHLFIPTHIFPSLIHSFLSSKQFYISFSDAPVVYRVPQRGERRQQLPCMDTVCVFVCYFPFYDMRQKGEKHFFTIQVKFNRRELKKEETWMRFYFQSAEPFTLDIVAQGLFIRCAHGLLLWRDISHLLLFFFKRNPDRKKDRERKWKKRERERGMCPTIPINHRSLSC